MRDHIRENIEKKVLRYHVVGNIDGLEDRPHVYIKEWVQKAIQMHNELKPYWIEKPDQENESAATTTTTTTTTPTSTGSSNQINYIKFPKELIEISNEESDIDPSPVCPVREFDVTEKLIHQRLKAFYEQLDKEAEGGQDKSTTTKGKRKNKDEDDIDDEEADEDDIDDNHDGDGAQEGLMKEQENDEEEEQGEATEDDDDDDTGVGLIKSKKSNDDDDDDDADAAAGTPSTRPPRKKKRITVASGAKEFVAGPALTTLATLDEKSNYFHVSQRYTDVLGDRAQIRPRPKTPPPISETENFWPSTIPPPYKVPKELEGVGIVSVSVFHSSRRTKSQEWILMTSQPLTDLRDSLRCLADYTVDGELYQHSACFFIEGIFYDDTRDPRHIRFSEPIMKWYHENESNCTIGPRMGDLHEPCVKTMENYKIEDLTVRLNTPYVYIHQGDCEHVFFFSEVRLPAANDPQSAGKYPHQIYYSRHRLPKCVICNIYTGKWVTLNNRLAPINPCIFCDSCYRHLHFDAHGKLIREGNEDLKVFPLFDD